MNYKTTLSISEARKKIFQIAENVQKPGTYYTFTENGRSKAVLMSAEELESWRETLNVVRDFPDLKKDIKTAREEYKKGDYITINDLLLSHGYVFKDSSKQKYGTSNSNSKKSSKRNK